MTRATFAVATYNVHRCVGNDRRLDPDRVAEVIASLDCDAVGLQEVDCQVHDDEGFDQLEHLARRVGTLHYVAGPTFRRASVTMGNAILSRPPVLARRWIDLSVRGREPRGALDVDLDVRGRRVRVVNTHLGLRPGERAWQAERLLASLSPGFEDVLVVMGDFNEWHRWGRARALLERELGGVSSRATFPAWRPWLALDRVWVRPHARVVDVRVVATPATRQASDHLPLRVEFDLG